MRATSARALLLLAATAVGCDDTRPFVTDAGPDDAGSAPMDAGPDDAGPVDAGWPPGTTCTPGYACPTGAVFRTDGTYGRCLWEDVELPSGATVEPYCLYFDMGYVGYSWPLAGADPSYTCPPTARYAPNGEGLGFCLWEDFDTPPGASEDCGELLSNGRLGFRWRCP
jgi:hypothetical protein